MKRLTKKQMWIFAVGQLGWSILGGIINAWLVTFYLPTKGDIDNGAISFIESGFIFWCLTILGIITFVCRIFDSVTDPVVATLSDRCKSKKGRRIPFMRYSAIPFAVCTILVFLAPVNHTSSINAFWILGFLLLFYLFMTMYCTPYNALISEFGKTDEDRMYISTAISLTYFLGTVLAYLPFVLGGPLQAFVSFNNSYRICFVILAVIALVCMLLPTFLLNEREFVEAKPSESSTFKSLTKTFKNKDFRLFVGSDIAYWIGLTLFQTGLPFFVKVSMGLNASYTMFFLAGMTIISACFYPIVSRFVKKFGKKNMTIAGFLGLALAYLITALIGVIPLPGIVFGILIVLVAAFPMALLGIIPQAIVADIALYDGKKTNESREGMFFAARTFAMKLGQSIAMLVFTSLAIIGTVQGEDANEITASEFGLRIVAIVAIAFCLIGALVLKFYNEKKIKEVLENEDK